MDSKKIIGKAIKDKRVKVKKTQTQVSEDTGISRSYLSDMENGRYMPSVETLVFQFLIGNLVTAHEPFCIK